MKPKYEFELPFSRAMEFVQMLNEDYVLYTSNNPLDPTGPLIYSNIENALADIHRQGPLILNVDAPAGDLVITLTDLPNQQHHGKNN